ncbi:MAG: 6-aminohexanoate hydrolase [Rhodobacteraceae bacterium]|nr:6-aminohexanoate hydrolase [Paracoccaceae bacterium]
MLSRRTFSLSLAGSAATTLALPARLRAQSVTPQDVASAAAGMDQLHAILVQRGDDILVSDAPRGGGLGQPANIKSCSKSLVALVLGTAIDRGEIAGLSTTLAEAAPRLIPSDATPGAEDLTFEDLVTLRAGLERTSGANYGPWIASNNWVAYALRQPRVAENGGRMIYSTGTTHVLGAALSEATGQDLATLMRRRLGSGLGIEIPGWTRDPQGRYMGGNQMALTPRAMLKVAVMMRDGGRFEGQQVIPADWVADSGRARARSPYSGLGYGLGWFISRSGWLIARGYGGQVIACNADLDLALAITSDPTRPARSQGYFGDLMTLIEGPVSALA